MKLANLLVALTTCAVAGSHAIALAADEAKPAEGAKTEEKTEAPAATPKATTKHHATKHHKAAAAKKKSS